MLYDVSIMQDLIRNLLIKIGEDPDREGLIRADERSIHRYFARVAALCREAGINEVKVGYILEEPKAVPVR